jgi:hypothetical protein
MLIWRGWASCNVTQGRQRAGTQYPKQAGFILTTPFVCHALNTTIIWVHDVKQLQDVGGTMPSGVQQPASHQ